MTVGLTHSLTVGRKVIERMAGKGHFTIDHHQPRRVFTPVYPGAGRGNHQHNSTQRTDDMEILALWAICGAFSAVIAQSKGRDTLLWAVVGTCTGVIGLIWVACLPAMNKPDAG